MTWAWTPFRRYNTKRETYICSSAPHIKTPPISFFPSATKQTGQSLSFYHNSLALSVCDCVGVSANTFFSVVEETTAADCQIKIFRLRASNTHVERPNEWKIRSVCAFFHSRSSESPIVFWFNYYAVFAVVRWNDGKSVFRCYIIRHIGRWIQTEIW